MGSASCKKSHIYWLDAIRFAAAVMVVFFHLSWQQADARIGFDPGWVGVEIFFVISGFVIMGSAINVTPIDFLERRFARLYPAAIACALINYPVIYPFAALASAHDLHVGASLRELLDSMLLLRGPFMVSALWTLPIELGFYVLIVAMLVCKWIARATTLAGVLIVWSGLYIVPFALTEYAIGPLHVLPLGIGLLNLTMLRHGCFFGVGILLWQMLNHTPRIKDWFLLALGMVLGWLEIIARAAEVAPSYARPVDVAALAGAAVTTFSMAVFAIWASVRLNGPLRPGPGVRAILRQIGLMSYPLYLMHEGVGGVAFSLMRRNGYGQGSALLCGLALTLLASLLVVQALEPWLRRRLLKVLHPVLERLTENPAVAQTLGKFTART
ncbi:MAG TPA: acyltransferase [Paraburkholderia sp.]|jgi:peptidoglycan/LPS O-acetylase OafA/YrhL|nr:acyltransferase [Paraburkholderia sp.]